MNWTRDLSKSQKRELRRIAALAYDRELTTALRTLDAQFHRWRSGEIGPHELADAIHAFHQGPNRELWSRYSGSASTLSAAYAVVRGIVSESEVATDLLPILKSHYPPAEWSQTS
jgi:hypothetical protein